MNIRDFSLELQKVYDEIGETFSQFQNSTNLHCLEGCGKCCSHPEVEASVLEMYPLALKILDEGTVESWLEKLENPAHDHCLMFESHSPDNSKGQCGIYQERPSLCRMFGVAGYFDKHHEVTLSVCKPIKEKYPELLISEKEKAKTDHPPMLSDWSYKLSQLDPALTQDRMPINQAMKIALEKVALHASYERG